MQPIPFEQTRKLMLDILLEVADFCDSHSLTYTLSSGTLIGAIRHNGFIPWDDDIDIDMPRPDYERFIELYRKEGRYALCAPGDKDSLYFFTKVYDKRTIKRGVEIDENRFESIGIDIDIFPIDGLADDETAARKELDRALLVHKFLYCSVKKKSEMSWLERLFAWFCRLMGKDLFIRKYVQMAKRHDYLNANYVGIVTPYHKYKYRFRRGMFRSRTKVTFEGYSFWIPSDYNSYLTNVYGNYMTPPPENEKLSTHRTVIYWKDDIH